MHQFTKKLLLSFTVHVQYVLQIEDAIDKENMIMIVKIGNLIEEINGKGLIMSVNNLKRQRGCSITDNRTYNVMVVMDIDPYWDEGLKFYPIYKRGFKNSNKRILKYQCRMYRTWKHNRKTQWKNNGVVAQLVEQ